MKQRLGVIVLLCLTVLMLCACDKQDKNENGYPRLYTSLYVETYGAAQWNAFTEIYDILFPQDRLPLMSDIELRMRSNGEMAGDISFRMANTLDKEVWDEKIEDTKRYVTVATVLSDLQGASVTVYYGGHAISGELDTMELMEALSEERDVYQNSVEGLQRLLNELDFCLTEEETTRLWTIGQTIQVEYAQLQELRTGENAALDVALYSIFFDENAETNRYQVQVYVLPDENLRTDEEYAKSAEVLMSQYAQIEQITFRILKETYKNSYETEREIVFI